MASFGLDTSVVLRLLVGEPRDQAQMALDFVESMFLKGARTPVSDLVIAEVYFALYRHYRVPKMEALLRIRDMLESRVFSHLIGSVAPHVFASIESMPSKPGFVDQMIHAQYHLEASSLVTFESAGKKAVGSPGAETRRAC